MDGTKETDQKYIDAGTVNKHAQIYFKILYALRENFTNTKTLFQKTHGLSTSLAHLYLFTLPTSKILSGKNARAFLVCGFLMKSSQKKYPENLKKIVGAVWELPAKWHSQSSPI